MNQLFNFRRFGLLLKLHFVQNGKIQLLSAGLIVGLMLVLMIPMLASKAYSSTAEVLHILAFFLCVLLGGSLFTNSIFNQYGNPGSGIPVIMVPASQLEKFLVNLLVSFIFISFFIILFWQLHFNIIDLANETISTNGRKYFYTPEGPRTFFNYCYFIIYGVIFLGSIYFPKNTYVKSAGALLVISLLAFFLHYSLASYFTSYPSFLWTLPFSAWRLNNQKEIKVDFPEPIDDVVRAFLIILILSLCYIAYVRLKEKQI